MKRSWIPGWSALWLAGLVLPALAAEPAKPGTGIHYVYLIRHGIYDPDPDKNADDVVANGLNTLGRDQARLVGARLAAHPAPDAASPRLIQPVWIVASSGRQAKRLLVPVAPPGIKTRSG